jgi:hypothetical protein
VDDVVLVLDEDAFIKTRSVVAMADGGGGAGGSGGGADGGRGGE